MKHNKGGDSNYKHQRRFFKPQTKKCNKSQHKAEHSRAAHQEKISKEYKKNQPIIESDLLAISTFATVIGLGK